MQISRRGLEIASLSMILTLFFLGCNQHMQSRRFVQYVNFSSYVSAKDRSFQSPRGTYNFPTLLVFNGQGQLVYRGTVESQENELLLSLPDGFKKLRPLEPEVRITDVYQNYRELRDLPMRPLANGRMVILSISMERCESCEVEESTIDQTMKKLKNKPVDLVELIVKPPLG